VPAPSHVVRTLQGEFEQLIYRAPCLQWSRLWQLLVHIQRHTPDAYHSIGTFCVVVVEMQREQERDQSYSSSIYLASALENLACAQEHGWSSEQMEPTATSLSKTIKYIYRTLYSIHRTSPGLETRSLVGVAREFNKIRDNVNFHTSLEYKTYTTYLEQIRETIRRFVCLYDGPSCDTCGSTIVCGEI
jgi:hypothetical protein